jgi:hypothetical protein
MKTTNLLLIVLFITLASFTKDFKETKYDSLISKPTPVIHELLVLVLILNRIVLAVIIKTIKF